VIDRQTVGQTDRQTDAIAIASTALETRALRRAVKPHVRTVLYNNLQCGFGIKFKQYTSNGS